MAIDAATRHAYEQVLITDRAFRAALVAAYGEANAGEMRYRYQHPNHPEVVAAGERFKAAAEHWRTVYSAAREDGNTAQ